MTRKATTHGGQLCSRCNRILGASLDPCQCTEGQLDQFDSESEGDQQAVNRMLFITKGPQDVQAKHWSELMQLYRQNTQLAERNGVPSPFKTG
jgi:hypothetical protein